MDLFVEDARVAQLEAQLPRLAGVERLRALIELAWQLRQRDTWRARALALEAGCLAEGHPGLMARVHLTLAECDRLFLELRLAREEAIRAFEGFESASDEEGAATARWLLVRLGQRDGSNDAGEDARSLPRSASRAAIECQGRHEEALALLQSGAPDRAIECLSRVAQEASALGMYELALDAELAVARTFATLRDDEAAIGAARQILDVARANGWRGLVAAASATLSQCLMRGGQPAEAIELLGEAHLTLAAVQASGEEAAILCLLGEAQVSRGDDGAALESLGRAEQLLREHQWLPRLAHVIALQARVLARSGHLQRAIDRAGEALRVARDARTRPAEMEALRVLGELHGEHGADPSCRSALAFLRHALDIAEEIDETAERASLLRDIARLQESAGDVAGALACERAARAAEAQEIRRAEADHACAVRARQARDQQRVERRHRQALEEAIARHQRELEASRGMLEQLGAIGQDLMERPDAAALVETLERHLAKHADLHYVALFVFDAGAGSLRRYAREAGRAIPMREVAAGDMESYVARCARERRELHVEVESGNARDHAEQGESVSLWFGPICDGESATGVLSVQSRRPHAYGANERLLFRSVSAYVAVALAKARMRQELERQRAARVETEEQIHRLATIDRLTALATRAHFFTIARERLERARRDLGPCGLIVADIDGFKGINDTRGHEAGDRVLAAMGRVLMDWQRPDDIVGRIGGDEFALFLPGASLEMTVKVAERLRTAIEGLRVVVGGRPVPVTMSFGCTALADPARDIVAEQADGAVERLMREADAALYEAQGAGGNRTIAWPAYEALRALRGSEPLVIGRDTAA